GQGCNRLGGSGTQGGQGFLGDPAGADPASFLFGPSGRLAWFTLTATMEDAPDRCENVTHQGDASRHHQAPLSGESPQGCRNLLAFSCGDLRFEIASTPSLRIPLMPVCTSMARPRRTTRSTTLPGPGIDSVTVRQASGYGSRTIIHSM